MPPAKKKKSQTRLTFESVGASSSSPVSAYSPARVRYSRAAHSSPAAARRLPSIATSSSPAQTANSARKRKSKQSRLDNSIAPPASFMPNFHGQHNRAVANDSSDDSAAEIGDAGHDEDDVDLLPPTQMANTSHTPGTSESEDSDEVPKIRHPRSSQSVSTRLQRTVIDDEDDDQDEGQDREPELPTLPSPRKRRCPSVISLDDSDDAPILPSTSSRKFPKQALVVLDDSDENLASPSKKRKMFHHSSPNISGNNRTPGRLKRPSAIASSPTKKAHKGHRSDKQKKMELLRRRRAGEKIDQLSSSESASDEEEKRGIYDTDSENGLEVLRDFDDEEQEEVKEQPAPRKEKQKREREKPRDQESDGGDLDGFVTDDDDAPLGVPVDIPLEFTSHAHKPLKDQFPFVIEWLVHNRINPAFERKDPIYVNAWRKLDDEVSGLANSKFTSAAWKPDFHRALRSRPGLDSIELRQLGTNLYETCEACGRSGHPSTYRIIFSGSAYHKDTLAEVESDSDNEDDNDTASVDSRGMPLPPTTKEWLVGSVCCSNAETAHSLLHWKHALKQWVEERLEDEGWMTGQKLSEREKMKAKSRRALANSIVDKWQESGVIGALYGDFKNTIENARNQSTTGRGMKGRLR
ncbi:hypothetical protein FHL15_009493 [Xylaria flabelliformis]|uniref:DUF4211 domain-containing protein n=1 Tax=Xylaria flabelliformis TaxID=2512241 RepID=A0A553HNN7_9PEZI|nr:hypothetical protein FHL15_009493 [Xylaria flabelliformis]